MLLVIPKVAVSHALCGCYDATNNGHEKLIAWCAGHKQTHLRDTLVSTQTKSLDVLKSYLSTVKTD